MTDRAEIARRLAERLGWDVTEDIGDSQFVFYRRPRGSVNIGVVFPPADAPLHEALAFVGHLAQAVEPWGWKFNGCHRWHGWADDDGDVFEAEFQDRGSANNRKATCPDVALAAALAVLEIPQPAAELDRVNEDLRRRHGVQRGRS